MVDVPGDRQVEREVLAEVHVAVIFRHVIYVMDNCAVAVDVIFDSIMVSQVYHHSAVKTAAAILRVKTKVNDHGDSPT